MQEKRNISFISTEAPTIDVEQRESLLGVIVQSPQAANPGTGQTPAIVKTPTEPESNPYAERGFKRGHDEKPTLRNFLCYYSLSSGIVFSAVFDTAQATGWLIAVFVCVETIEWPFHLIYFFLCLCRLFYFARLNRQDTEQHRLQLYQAHLATTLAIGVIYLLQFLVTFIATHAFPAAIFVWMILSTSF